MTNPLFKKPNNMRWVDMAIWIDNNIYDSECDMNTAFTYMYLLAYMLASKAKYFSNIEDYDNYAYYLAYSTYVRMTDKTKVKLKSVLNYMKSIMYFRKMSYNTETYNEIIDPVYNKGWDGDQFINKQMESLEASTRYDILQLSINYIFSDIPEMIKRNIPKVYKSDKVIYNNLYESVLLSMISWYTLKREFKEDLNTKINNNAMFDEMTYYKKHLTRDIILWHLPKSLENVVQLIINKTNKEIVNTIKSISNDAKITNHDYDIISRSAYGDHNTYEEYQS